MPLQISGEVSDVSIFGQVNTNEISGSVLQTEISGAVSSISLSGSVSSINISGSVEAGDIFSLDAQAVFDLMDTELSNALKLIISTFVDSQVLSGNWALINQFLVVLDTENNSLIDWTGTQNALAVNSPTFTAYTKFQFNGSTNYVNTQKAPGTLNDNYVGLFIGNTGSSGGSPNPMGSETAFNRRYRYGSGGGAIRAWNHSNQVLSVTSSWAENSYFSQLRTSSTAVDFRKNGSSLISGSKTVGFHSSVHIYIGGYNLNNSLGANPWPGSMFAFINGQGTIDDTNLYDNLKIMKTAINALAA